MQPHDLAWAAGHIITFDGNTVLTYDAETEAPRWLSELDADITALAASDRLLVVATADNAVRGFNPRSGAEQWTHTLEGAAFSVAVADDHWAVAFADTVARGEGAQIVKEYPASGVQVVAFGPNDALAVGTSSGLSVVGQDGVTQAQLDDITGVAAAPTGGWYVTAGPKLFHLDDEMDVIGGTQMSDTIFSMPFVSPSKRYVAVRVDDDYVSVYTTDGLKQAGWVAYKERTIGAVTFGPKDWLGVAVGTGHANKMHLGAGMICRTDEHPGRARSSWMLSFKAVDEHWGASAPEAAGGVGPAENPVTTATVDAPDASEGSPAQTVLGLVVAAVVGVAVYFLMQ
jgi:hypothetical protein